MTNEGGENSASLICIAFPARSLLRIAIDTGVRSRSRARSDCSAPRWESGSCVGAVGRLREPCTRREHRLWIAPIAIARRRPRKPPQVAEPMVGEIQPLSTLAEEQVLPRRVVPGSASCGRARNSASSPEVRSSFVRNSALLFASSAASASIKRASIPLASTVGRIGAAYLQRTAELHLHCRRTCRPPCSTGLRGSSRYRKPFTPSVSDFDPSPLEPHELVDAVPLALRIPRVGDLVRPIRRNVVHEHRGVGQVRSPLGLQRTRLPTSAR